MTRTEKIVTALAKELAPELRKENVQLNRKLRIALQQRDEWRERAMRYRQQYLAKEKQV